MATRRSRLQIKPNILGGPKVSGSKPTPKTQGKATSKEGSDAAKPEAAEEVKSPVKVTSPKKNIHVSPLKEIASHKEETDKVAAAEKDAVLSVNKETVNLDSKSAADDSKTDVPALPARTRIRKFGKVNISAARSAKIDSQQSTDTALDNENTTEKVETETHKTTDIHNNDNSAVGKNSTEDVSSSGTMVQRRSRFPKAKPNIADAGRRRQKEVTSKEETLSINANDKSKEIPETAVTDSVKSDTDHQPNQKKPETPQSMDSSAPALTQIVPRPPATPTSVLKSPLKHPTPTIPVSPEKRARTVSITEPPVVKRQRKPKVDAPTDKPPDRSTMKMKDLIRWNPSNNPMKPKVKTGTVAVGKVVEKENVNERRVTGDEAEDAVEENEPEAADSSLPVPQVTIGPDGNIVINEKSLILKDPELEKAPSQENEVIDETDMFTTYGSFRKRNVSKRWSKKETKKFYKALAMIGIDFFLINQLFPNRTRFEIKKKFKKEEKINRALIEKVLKERIKFDPTVFDAQDESSDEEERQKEKKGGKKKEKNKTEKEQTNQQVPVKKRTTKRKTARRNYYEDDTSEEEEEPVQKKSSTSATGPHVSQKDGEVVGILMDMSEGRITGEGQGSEDISGGSDRNKSEKLVAVPANKVQKRGAFIPIAAKISHSASQGQYSADNENVTLNIPGIQSISIMETQQIDGAGSSTTVNTQPHETDQNISYSNSEILNRRIYLPDLNRNNSAVAQSNIQQTINPEVQYNQRPMPGREGSVIVGSSSSQLQPGTNQLQQLQVPVVNSQLSNEDADQYVLVTVMPEGGGETVIHIYRLHGGGQSQDEVLYADTYASQQVTIGNSSGSDSVVQQQTQTGIQEILSGEIPAVVNYPQVDTQIDLTSSHTTTPSIPENTNANITQSDIQGTSVGDKLLLTTNSDVQASVDIDQSDSQEAYIHDKLLVTDSDVLDSAVDEKTLSETDIQIIITDG